MKKLSAILIEMTEKILARPARKTSDEGLHAALLLAHVAWNRAVDISEAGTGRGYLDALAKWEKENPAMRAELKSCNCEELIERLIAFKEKRYADDNRFIHVCGTVPSGNVHVEWTYREIRRMRKDSRGS